jgi:glutamyl-tRNA reductase
MNITVLGLNHRTADVELREKLAFSEEKLPPALTGLTTVRGVHEAVILSTCNRVEIYLNCDEGPGVTGRIEAFLSEFHSVEAGRVASALYAHSGAEGVRHVFRVASSLDSMVLGEPQILGQLKDAFELALGKHTSGIVLNKLMKKAISVAKRVRTETRIAENAVSIGYAAVELAKKIFTDLSGKECMLLGAGEMAELAAKHLVSSGVRDVAVANRTYERGCALAREFSGRAVRFENFKDELKRADILICSTGAQNYVLTRADMEKIMKERRRRSIFIIDISVPRNIDPAINDLDDVYLYDIDDLQGVVDTNLDQRKLEALKAEEIVTEEVEVFNSWMKSLDAVPTIVALREMAENVRKDEVERLFNRLSDMGDIGEPQKKAIEQTVATIVNKLIHPPTYALKSDNEDRDQLIAVIKRLYGLNGTGKG